MSLHTLHIVQGLSHQRERLFGKSDTFFLPRGFVGIAHELSSNRKSTTAVVEIFASRRPMATAVENFSNRRSMPAGVEICSNRSI
ncbi:hypothetical protein COX84_03130 [Candidatus Micrarchaeota archaeon CG_4_10_14_0_2_um_filter_49_7]|nr:MAG: hypothetical protein COX84_03130 [Candidatus Micrarchaeota archaeon CG_4_10_14_0_2_um_filter_49_7]